ncbi:hypothetical protein CALCODRAFT_483862 [Calocera cornea HHB12733]|uniref:Elongator complex protein 5 n=1 Tax=Calocera cornea HHB12733 TaxID=1353952 RepID=A0A165FE98_9BASI|nr:hypothetical protein CALCODRAFT_483862 [Calocera cornea HHB12733]
MAQNAPTPLASLLTAQSSSPRSPSAQPELLLLQAPYNAQLPLLRSLLRAARASKHSVLVGTWDVPGRCFRALDEAGVEGDRGGEGWLRVLDFSGRVPGYELDDEGGDAMAEVLAASHALPNGPATILLLGLDTVSSDTNRSHAYALVRSLLPPLSARPSARLILPLPPSSPLLPLFLSPTLSPDLTHLLVHPTSLLPHLAQTLLTLPPPYGPEQRFWALFTSASERGEGRRPRLVALEEGVVESRVRRRGRVHRALGGWRVREREGAAGAEACAWEELPGMREMIDGVLRTGPAQATASASADPTQNLPFNLLLTPAQLAARASVPIPYAHTGQSPAAPTQGEIIYDPDSGDDVDDDDPDEDLDI